ncbi:MULTISPECIES: hypothetical protein [Paenibacillus]|uniref:hypothetical protein n=1 Tax=Paenibacillus TaxID=44249 RepID=UPI0022B85D4E|nr:hypothetical protein [Paenibacillus caseinilyticus]MCZ8521051.1 hypothetical protein [Paenibacillus caseinilyticus]
MGRRGTGHHGEIPEDLLRACRSRLGWREIGKIEPVRRGWLNLKWKMETECGAFLL